MATRRSSSASARPCSTRAANARDSDAVKTVKSESRVSPDLMFPDLTRRTTSSRARSRDGGSWSEIVECSGVDEPTIRRIAELYANAKAVIACWAMGITQHKHAVGTIHEIVNVMLLRGNIGRPGAGLCPVRGHSNVQGDRTMGIDHHLRHPFLDALGCLRLRAAARRHGHDTVATIRGDGAAECMSAFVCSAVTGSARRPTPQRTARGSTTCNLTVSISTKVNRTHLYPGKRALILPCLARTEPTRRAS